LFELFFKAFGHPDKFHRVEFIKGLLVEHRGFPFIVIVGSMSYHDKGFSS
jgi:hypothetical protein